jgi:hypothetical protein
MKLRDSLSDGLKTFVLFERVTALVCIAIPMFLRIGDAGNTGFRPSISNYVYMDKSYLFGLLLCIASMLFIYNGIVYFKNEINFSLGKHGKWYNVVLGFSLMGVILFPHLQYPIPHYTFAIIFFVGNAFVTGFFHFKNNRIPSIILAILTVAVFALSIFDIVSLLWAEWLSLTVIAIHFALEANEVKNIQRLKLLAKANG